MNKNHCKYIFDIAIITTVSKMEMIVTVDNKDEEKTDGRRDRK